jgi:hypothetical protein
MVCSPVPIQTSPQDYHLSMSGLLEAAREGDLMKVQQLLADYGGGSITEVHHHHHRHQ